MPFLPAVSAGTAGIPVPSTATYSFATGVARTRSRSADRGGRCLPPACPRADSRRAWSSRCGSPAPEQPSLLARRWQPTSSLSARRDALPPTRTPLRAHRRAPFFGPRPSGGAHPRRARTSAGSCRSRRSPRSPAPAGPENDPRSRPPGAPCPAPVPPRAGKPPSCRPGTGSVGAAARGPGPRRRSSVCRSVDRSR